MAASTARTAAALSEGAWRALLGEGSSPEEEGAGVILLAFRLSSRVKSLNA